MTEQPTQPQPFSESLIRQIAEAAKTLDMSQEQLLEAALRQLLQNDRPIASPQSRMINQGDIFRVRVPFSDIPHPYVIVQEDVFNHSRITTVVAVSLTSNLKRASYPGNVLLELNEANLPRQSVVEVSKVTTLEKSHLYDYIGTLPENRTNQIIAGMRLQQRSFGK
ncbi:MAG: type II toxin-antitoxin system PemK/MazF family toxin [Chloroflexota bacterium]